MKKTIFKVLLALLILAFLFWKLNLNVSHITASVKNAWYLLAAFLFPVIINPMIVNNRWRSFLKMICIDESWPQLAKLTFKSTFLGILFPSSQGYDVLRILFIEKRHPDKRGAVGSTIVVERLLGLICLLFIAMLAWFVTRLKDAVLPIVGLFVLVAMLCVFLFSEKCYSWLHRLLIRAKHAKKLSSYIDKLYMGIHNFPFNKTIAISVLLILLLQIANIVVVYLLFLATGNNISLWEHLCIMPLVSVITMIPITFGGLGLREGGFIFFYSSLCVPNETIISVSLLYYIVIMLVPALIGGVIYLHESLQSKRQD